MTWPGASLVRRMRANEAGDPARPHLVATSVAAGLVGVTGPLVLAGFHARVNSFTAPMGALAVIVWALLVAVVLHRVLPWQSLVMRGLRLESAAMRQVRATPAEQRRFRLTWLLQSSGLAGMLMLVPVDAVVGVGGALLEFSPGTALLWGAASTIVGALTANVPIVVACLQARAGKPA